MSKRVTQNLPTKAVDAMERAADLWETNETEATARALRLVGRILDAEAAGGGAYIQPAGEAPLERVTFL